MERTTLCKMGSQGLALSIDLASAVSSRGRPQYILRSIFNNAQVGKVCHKSNFKKIKGKDIGRLMLLDEVWGKEKVSNKPKGCLKSSPGVVTAQNASPEYENHNHTLHQHGRKCDTNKKIDFGSFFSTF
ncbi:hypothetical protein J6590_009261 [Homalodisca vitripennis]|nr:hypothetical protein J6590_009261 [Homalodisca vitripennis]